MIRATTPTHRFFFDVDPEESFQKILITYAQNGQIVLEKHESDLSFESCEDFSGKSVYIASLKLTQEETNLFNAKPKGTVSIQVRAITPEGDAVASDISNISVENVLNDEVLTCD